MNHLSLEQKLQTIVTLAKEYKVKQLLLFGSCLENPETANDIDIAVDIEDSLFFKFSAKVERAIHSPIDVIPIEPNSKFIQYIKTKARILI